MEWVIVAIAVVALGAIGYFLVNLQKSLLVLHHEQSRDQEAKLAALRGEITQALQANRLELQQGLSVTTQSLEGKFSHIDGKLATGIRELSQNVQTSLTANLKQGFEQFEKVQQTLLGAEMKLKDLSAVGSSIHELNNLLKLPHLRGGFGEMTLERLLCDLLPRDGYELQYQLVPTSPERVDAIVRYPQQVLPIDSKFPREQVLALFESHDPLHLEGARKALTDVIRKLAKAIKDKYIRPDHGTTEMALLFVPSETLYFEVLRNLKLGEELARLKVFIVSPNTLGVTLHSISLARTYYDMAKGVEKTIEDLRKARAHFENFEKRFGDVGVQLGRAQSAFQMAGTHLSRYDSAVRRLTGEAEIDAPQLNNAAPELGPVNA